MKASLSANEQQPASQIPDNCAFYQTLSLPGVGVVKGSWDYREGTDAYLGNMDFKGKQVLDVGPANGFFSFEMEKRGGRVVAIDLGKDANWDAVPHPDVDVASLKEVLRDNVRRVENGFWFAHKILHSKVDLLYGSVYETPSLIDNVDVALMSNVLQHFRDPFRAVEQVSKVVSETMIITESLWIDDDTFIDNPMMRLIPAVTSPSCTHSWWQVSPSVVIEILKLLGYPQIKCGFHKQQFNGVPGDETARLVPHFTVTGSRTIGYVSFEEGWHEEERDGKWVWHWSSQKKATLSITVPGTERHRAQFSFGLASALREGVQVYLNESPVWQGQVTSIPQPIYLQGLELKPGENSLEIHSAREPTRASPNDRRRLGVKIYNFSLTTIEQRTSSNVGHAG